MIKMKATRLRVVTILLLALAVLMAGNFYLQSSSNAQAADGGVLRQFVGEYSQPCSINTGLAFDGTDLIVSCWYNNTLDFLSTTDGTLQSTTTVPGYSGLMANAWDNGRGQLWQCAEHSKVLLVNTSDGSSVQYAYDGRPCTDGLAYDGMDDTLWISPYVSNTIYHYSINNASTSLTLMASFPLAGLVGSCGNSGIAVGGADLFLANKGCSEIYRAPKTLGTSTLFASFVERLEDMECDDITFAGSGVGAIWSGDAYDRIFRAYEIEAGLCAFGGGGEPAKGRMIGGGSIPGSKFRHGFELHCDLSMPNNLEINWGKGNKFHLTSLTSAICSDDANLDEANPVAGFDTFVGSGIGRLNGVDGATIDFTFTDDGEPGKGADWAEIDINGGAITASGFLNKGNHQAHPD